MALRTNLVNLDAMIKREDFAAQDSEDSSIEMVPSISLRDFTPGGLIGPNLRKPDFQRETNHWTPEQVVSLLECFINGDLIPSVILWRSPTSLFVIDGGHRLSVLKAWIEDDYGDGPTSQNFFGFQISDEQRKNAQRTRALIASRVGSWQHHAARNPDDELSSAARRRINAVATRALQIQWVKGGADKAESSFFKINTKGTPLDEIEELLLRSRKKPIPIAARAIIRAATGHRYWSAFESEHSQEIERLAKEMHSILFDPEIKRPIKTLDLPLGGPKGVRTALQTLIDLALIAARDQQGNPKKLQDTDEDATGEETIRTLKRMLALVKRITGNDNGSLGLHPAVYFYGPTGRHSGPMFMGTMQLIGNKISNNDKSFFAKFTNVRSKLEDILIGQKDVIATILQRHVSSKRVEKYSLLLSELIVRLNNGEELSEADLVKLSGLDGKIIIGGAAYSKAFSDDTKSQVFIKAALSNPMKCPICNGLLDTDKSVSYDHVLRAREGGLGGAENCSLTHPYCNQSVKA